MLANYHDIFMTREEAESELGMPVLGMIPQIEADALRVIRDVGGFSPVMETFRNLRAQIRFATLDYPVRSIAVTSALAAEGKSTIATNLAHVLAMDGKRVIVIDADLRRPTLHQIFDIPVFPGLTDVLPGSHSIENALQETNTPGIHLLPAGTIPANPPELLGSPAMERLLEEAASRCDIVLMDTSPILCVADGLLAAHRTDATLLIVDEETIKKNIQRTLVQLARARANVIGTVFNRLRIAAGEGSIYAKYYASSEPSEGKEEDDRT